MGHPNQPSLRFHFSLFRLRLTQPLPGYFCGPTKSNRRKECQVGKSQHLRDHHLCVEMRTCLTKKTERLRFALMPAGPKPHTKMGAGDKSARSWECWL